MSLQLGDLRSNLQELYHALHRTQNSKLTLIANYSGKRVYNSTMGWGKVWTWFYNIAEWVLGSGLWLNNLKRAVVYTQELFEKQLPIIRYHTNQYAIYFRKACSGYEVDESECALARREITNWNRATLPFLKMTQQYRLEKLKMLYKLCFDQAASSEQRYFNFSEFHTVKRFQKIIDLEGITQNALPLASIEKISLGKKLNESDLKDVNKWVKTLNKNSCAVRPLHQGLKAIVAELNQNKGKDESCSLEVLENFLEDRGTQIFQQPDPVHLKWRDGLVKDAVVGGEFIVGDQISKKPWGFDRFKVFEIQNYPDLVLIVGHNQAILDMKKLRHDVQNGYGVEPAQLLGVEPNGRWAVMERLLPLHYHRWTSTVQNLTPEDVETAAPLVKLMQWLIEQQQTPANFSPKYLMFDQQQRLKSLVPTVKGPFDFTALEEFAFHCASGNLRIFQHLMESSGLAKHPVVRFYREMIVNSLNGDSTLMEDLGGIYNINDPKIIDQGVVLQKELLRLRQTACMKCLELHPNMDVSEIERKVSQSILQVYDKTKAAGIVWPTFSAMLFQSL